jgi:hypothetical protein
LAQVLGRSNTTNLIAKQTTSDVTEAEAIAQAKGGVAAAFEYPLQGTLPARVQRVLTHDQKSGGS